MSNGRLHVLTAVMMKMQVFWSMKPRRVANSTLSVNKWNLLRPNLKKV
jgi:hypothetical protein